MKKVIALSGPGESGKSDTIRKAYEQLLDQCLRSGRVNASVEANLKPKETAAVVTIDGVRIGFESMGDNTRRLAKSLQSLELRGCTIIICACRPARKFKAVVDALKGSSYDVRWLPKDKEGDTKSEQEAVNTGVAQGIVDMIEGWLPEK
jgi:hypothetical protein